MFATRDQENLIHSHQTTAAGKPLNQNIRALQPKTPGNTSIKTPFRVRNDENKPLAFQTQKTGLKDGSIKLDKSTFATPAEPRNRAPLGIKATNVKAQNFKTPAPGKKTHRQEKSANKLSTARKSARKIIVAPTDSTETNVLGTKDVEDEEPDYGYAPPPEVPMLDLPMEFPDDTDVHKNIFRRYGQVYQSSPKDENGFSIRLKLEEEMNRKTLERDMLELYEHAKQQLKQCKVPDPDRQVEAMIAAGPKKMRRLPIKQSNVTTVKARDAAAVLSDSSSLKAPTAAIRETSSSMLKKKTKPTFAVLGAKSTPTTKSAETATRAPAAVSRNTIGFPKAKKAPTILPSPERVRSKPARAVHEPRLQQSTMHPREFVELYGEPPEESEMWFRLKQHELFAQEAEGNDGLDAELADDLFDTEFFPGGLEGNDDEDVFQLPVPEA